MSFQPLTIENIPHRLGKMPQILDKIGPVEHWNVREIGDGNMNYVYHIEGKAGALIVKQALPYIRSVGESWPLTQKRVYFEYHALIRHRKSAPNLVPEVFHFDEEQAILIMEFLSPHIILRKSLMAQNHHKDLGKILGEFCANTLFKNSDLHLPPAQSKADTALFTGNVELCEATADVVFTSLYTKRDLNRHTSPYLDEIVEKFHQDAALKEEAQHLKWRFWTTFEALLHGDLHTGSIMVHESDVKVIDPEFAFYGPMGFDIGMLMANFFMAYYSQPGHVEGDLCRNYQNALLQTIVEFWHSFVENFTKLWQSERFGAAYCKSLFEDACEQRTGEQETGEQEASALALKRRLGQIFDDALGFCGVELHRRIIGISHNADFEEIADEALRANCELKALELGYQCILQRAEITTIDALIERAKRAQN